MNIRMTIGVAMALATLAAGCDGEDPTQAIANADAQSTTLSELGEMYLMYIKESGGPPESGKPLMKYATGFSSGAMAIQNRTVGVYWGVPIEKEGTAVLAYDSETPTAGGAVLLQDGSTILRMTADEFQAASKAPGNVEEPGKSKAGRKKNG